MKTIQHVIAAVVCGIIQAILRFDRRVLKRFLNIETPLYKFWWKNHVEYIQKKLDAERIYKCTF